MGGPRVPPTSNDVAIETDHQLRKPEKGMNTIRTEYEFTLPLGYVDGRAICIAIWLMRLATAADEILPLRIPAFRQRPLICRAFCFRA